MNTKANNTQGELFNKGAQSSFTRTPPSRIITKSIEDAVRLLEAVKAQFRIIMPDGAEYGELEVKRANEKDTRQKKRIFKLPYGTLHEYYAPFVANVQAGDVVQIPFGPFEAKQLRQAVSAWCCTNWGNGSVRTCVTDAHVEVLRV